MNLNISNKGIQITLDDFIDKMLAKVKGGILHGKNTPASPKLDLSKVPAESPRCDETEYQSLVGKFIHASNTARPNIAYVTLYLSIFLIGRQEEHMKAA